MKARAVETPSRLPLLASNSKTQVSPTSPGPTTISWKTRDLYFDGSSLQEVVDLVNQVYDAHLVISNKALASCQITVTFKDQSLDAILNVLELTLDLEILQEGNQFRLEGSGCNE